MSGDRCINVLDHGIVELLDHMGSDLTIVQAAQASFNNSSQEYGTREQGILRFLMREEHGVPFEHAVLSFRLRMPVFLARQFVKHRTSSWSEHSGRYSELENLFYVPREVRTQTGKPGSYTFEPLHPFRAAEFQKRLSDQCESAWSLYQSSLTAGVAKEQARLCLPVNIYTNVVWTINARSLFNVIRLRVDSHAQAEAQVYGKAMEDLARLVIPDTIDAFVASGRPKP